MPKVGDGYPMQPMRLLTLLTHHTSLLALNTASSVGSTSARLAQSVERKALNLVVVGSSPTVGVLLKMPGVSRIFFGGKGKQEMWIMWNRSRADLNRDRWIQSPEC